MYSNPPLKGFLHIQFANLARSAICHILTEAKESLSKTPKGTTSDSDRDSSVVSLPQNDKLSYPQGKLLCHSERSEESLPESLVAKRDSSLDSQAQNDNESNPQDKLPP